MEGKAECKIRAVVFDCGGVLAEDCPVLCYHHLSTKYPESERARIMDMHKRNYQLWNKFKIDKSYTEAMYWNDLINNEKLNESVDQMKQFLRDSLDSYPYTIATARKINLKCKIPIGILSNHSEEWFAAIADKFNFYDTFLNKDLVIVSQAVGLAKPDQKIFDLMFQRLKAVDPELVPQQVLFIDDKMNNVDAAIQYGFHGIEFDASERTEADLVAHLAEFGVHM